MNKTAPWWQARIQRFDSSQWAEKLEQIKDPKTRDRVRRHLVTVYNLRKKHK